MGEVPELVHAHDQEESGARTLRAQGPHRVDHIGRSVSVELQRRHLEARVRANGCAHHPKAYGPVGDGFGSLVRRLARRNPQDLVELERVRDVRRDGHVTDMGRVERAPEEPDAGRLGLGQGCGSSAKSSAAESEAGYSFSSRLLASSARSSYPIAVLAR